jgi:predicted lipid-binding transport protein (Tim44 family)
VSVTDTVAKFSRIAAAALTLTAFATPFATPEAVARAGSGFSTGSRGVKTYTPPAATRTAPSAAQPMQRSAQPAPAASAAAQAAKPAVAPSRFGGGFMGGLLGAGLLGALFGAGMFGGLGSLAGILGFVLQLALVGGLIYLAVAFFRRRSQPAMANMSQTANYQRSADEGLPRGAAGGSAPAPATTPITIQPQDFDSFERLLSVVQLAYGRQDQGALRSATTPEMADYFREELEANATRGVRNELADVKLLSGDLSESWSEASGEYATVAMKYALIDATFNIASGKVVGGNASKPQEVTEIWTFMRRHGGNANAWRLSAIQQVA